MMRRYAIDAPILGACPSWRLQREAPYPRLAFHPQDLDHPAVAPELGPTLDRWLTRHQPIAYEALRRRVLASTPVRGGAA